LRPTLLAAKSAKHFIAIPVLMNFRTNMEIYALTIVKAMLGVVVVLELFRNF
jgi:hypothetical protein